MWAKLRRERSKEGKNKSEAVRILSVYEFVRDHSIAAILGLEWGPTIYRSDLPEDELVSEHVMGHVAATPSGYQLESLLGEQSHNITSDMLLGSPSHVLNSFAPIYTKLFLLNQSLHFLGSSADEKDKVILSVRIPDHVTYVKQEYSSMKKAKQEVQAENWNGSGSIISPAISPSTSPKSRRRQHPSRSQSSSSVGGGSTSPTKILRRALSQDKGEHASRSRGNSDAAHSPKESSPHMSHSPHRHSPASRKSRKVNKQRSFGQFELEEQATPSLDDDESLLGGSGGSGGSVGSEGKQSPGTSMLHAVADVLEKEQCSHGGAEGRPKRTPSIVTVMGEVDEECDGTPKGFLSLAAPDEADGAPKGFLAMMDGSGSEGSAPSRASGEEGDAGVPQGFLALAGQDEELKKLTEATPQGFLAHLDVEQQRALSEVEASNALVNCFICYVQTTGGDAIVAIDVDLLCQDGSVSTSQLCKRVIRVFKRLKLGVSLTPYSDLKVQLWKMQNTVVATGHKIGVLLSLEGQLEEDQYYNNEKSTPAFERFLSILGDRVPLRDWKNYDAGLDTEQDRTGTHSVFREYCGMPIMFHVSTLLPYQPNKDQQLERKRHIGNDVVVIVFQEDVRCCFDPSRIASRFNQIFIVVRPLERLQNHYRVDVVAKEEIGASPPFLPTPPVFSAETLGQFLIEKILILETLAWSRLDTFARPIKRSRQIFFEELFKNVCE
eukprot:TRINITY_DN4154_c0_g1_i4.p1 TRINITY_DN4154_c0_g1~~TRINITY_DN4154_c0_g1_i4.p1  ORF type:complete len:720 (+),score=192.90 TRINITY_DN4154_c0_g1_i4:223-2382(+)